MPRDWTNVEHAVQNVIFHSSKVANFVQNSVQIWNIFVQIYSTYWKVFSLQTEKNVPMSKSI